jgi:hypothetical protein
MFATPLGGWLAGPAGTVSLGPLTIPATGSAVAGGPA